MSAKILAFDPNRKVPARHYTPIAMRGRLLHMASRSAAATANPATANPKIKGGLNWCTATPGQDRRRG
jgi:hypothetical protein